MTISADATDKRPTHAVKLSDGVNEVGLMLVDGQGKNNPLAIQRSPYPRTSTKIASGQGKYDDLELPYKSIVQDDWIGGRAALNLEDDVTRYMDNFRAWTDQEKQVCNGPQETYCLNYGATYRQNFQSMPGKVNHTALMGTTAYLAHSFTTVAAVTVSNLAIIIKRVGTPDGLLSAELWSDSGGSPNTLLQAATGLNTANIPDTISELRELIFVRSLSGTTTYWLVIHQSTGTPTTANHWEVGTNPDAATSTKKAPDGTIWTAAAQELYYRVIDDKDFKFKPFEYKRAIYAVDMQYTNRGHLFLNGDRGAADSNAGTLQFLLDATKNWGSNEWVGCTVLITNGPGADDKQPWRTIVSNNNTILVLSSSWETEHTTETEYVILGSNKWTYKTTLATYKVTDIEVAGEFVYIAGGGNVVMRYNEHNLAGVWTQTDAVETTAKASKLRAINTPDGWELWGSLNRHAKYGACVWRAKVPKKWSASADLYNLVSVLDDCKGVWDEQSVSNVTVTQEDDGLQIALAAGFTTGDACSKAMPPTDITKGTKLGMFVKSSVATALADLKLKLDDTPYLLRNYLPDKIWHFDTEVLPNDVVWRRAYYRPTAVNYFDASGATAPVQWFPIGNLINGTTDYDFKITWVGVATVDYLYVSFPERMSGVKIDMGATKNAVAASTMTSEVWTGNAWVALAITDGTSAGGVTLAQSGYIAIGTASNWNKGCSNAEATYLASDRFHIRFKVDKDLTADVQITRITAHGEGDSEQPDEGQFVSLKNIIDSDYSTYDSQLCLFDNDSIYIRYSKRFNRIKVTLDGLNNNASTILGYYWDGYQWIAITTAYVDGTASGGATLAASGDITYTMPTNWSPGCPSYLTPYLSETDFVVKLFFNVTDATLITDAVQINKITLEDDSLNEIFNWVEMNNVKDGDTNTYDYLNLTTDDYVYVMFSSKFNQVFWTLSVVNAIDTTMVAQYFNGHVWTTLTLTADTTAVGGFTLHQSGAMAFTIPHDWQPIAIGEETGYAVRFYPVADLTAGVKITEIYVRNDDATSLSIPALTANVWAYVEMAISPNATPNPDDSKIVSIGLNIAVDNGAQTITIGKVELITEAMDYFKLGNDRINSIEAYGSERQNPWVFTESLIYEIQTQNDNTIVPMPLREITGLRSELNGMAHTVSDVYLVFNLGAYIEKYYQNNMDDIGPNKDEGLPSNRIGDPTCMMSYPGRIFLAIDAKTTGYSTVMLRRSGGWHEIYRAPYGCPIHDLAIQVIPGMSTRLWISQEYDLLWLPLPTGTWNPKNDSNFRYTHESVITTGWINAGFMDVSKFWKSVKLYTENLSGTSQYIVCEYQTEDGALESGWTAITDVFDTSPFEEQTITASYNVTARRIRFRFKLITTSNAESPIMKASIFEALLRFPVKYSYAMTYRLEDYPEGYSGVKDMTVRAETLEAQLDTWADAPTVLTFTCPYSPYSNKKVVIEPSSLKPIQLNTEEQFEKHIGTITLLEV